VTVALDVAERRDTTLVGPPFPEQEYARRLDRIRAAMADADLDVLLITDPANMNYATGYDAWSFYVHQAIVVTRDGDAPVWIGRASDVNGVPLTTHLPRDNAVGYPETCIESVDDHAFRFIGRWLESAGLAGARVGVEMEAYYYTARCHAMLAATLPNATLVDATGLVNRVRLVKSDAEIALIRQAGAIVERAMQVAADTIAPGVRQNDAAAAILHAQVTGTEGFGGDYAAIVPMLPTGIGSGAPHLTWSDGPFNEGEATIIEIAGCRRRYHCPLARTLFLGTPPAAVRDTEAAVVEGVAAALDAARPGALARDVEAAWRASVARWGVVKESRLGYSIGINYPPDWGEHSTSLRPGDETVLAPNMTFHLMPGLWFEDWGIEISQPFRVTESGAEPLTDFPRALIVKD
jgi:ectoine hydrolase